ncbi:Levodione reductase [Neolecta irregularis DAH-3]|uniref:Levodione reductase n=1 Tax=Neolecta irregularis (strain DAH-3) TaxID=1198029 RepID=A0A1U7LQK5_NEOID|nr:Levodione reductase [Neolecta irregularis DAH-3]|eukprot:OLL24908.1 Levodione reductase [Neolecta irregularis DAH-3]
MSGRLQNKNCIITGAAGYGFHYLSKNSGIGIETAILFASHGAKVILSDINQKSLDIALAKVKHLVPHAVLKTQHTDVSKEAHVRALVAAAEEWGGVDVLFNNAGIMHPLDGDENTDEKVWELTHNINVKGVWFGCKYAIAAMRKHGRPSSIINTASVVALVGSAASQLAYTASKGAVLAMTRELAIVHARHNIRLNSLCPGPLNTPLLQAFLDTPEKASRRLIHLPMGRFGEAVEQAQVVVFLASDESSYLNAAEMAVDGGMTRAYVTSEDKPTAAPQNAVFGK